MKYGLVFIFAMSVFFSEQTLIAAVNPKIDVPLEVVLPEKKWEILAANALLPVTIKINRDINGTTERASMASTDFIQVLTSEIVDGEERFTAHPVLDLRTKGEHQIYLKALKPSTNLNGERFLVLLRGSPSFRCEHRFHIMKLVADPVYSMGRIDTDDLRHAKNPAALVTGLTGGESEGDDPSSSFFTAVENEGKLRDTRGAGLTDADFDKLIRWQAAAAGSIELSDAKGLLALGLGKAAADTRINLLVKHHRTDFPAEFLEVKVKAMTNIPCRVNLMGSTNTPNHFLDKLDRIQKHIDLANVYLFQTGFKLMLTGTQPGFTETGVSGTPVKLRGGVFDVRVDNINLLKPNKNTPILPRSAALNAKTGVVNINYISSIEPNPDDPRDVPGAGNAPLRAGNTNGTQIQFTYRIDKSTDPRRVRMNLLGEANFQFNGQEHKFRGVLLSASKLAAGEDIRLQDALYAQAIAHEVCHILSLKHRAVPDVITDNVPQAQKQKNVMFNAARFESQDLDLIQVHAMLASKFFNEIP